MVDIIQMLIDVEGITQKYKNFITKIRQNKGNNIRLAQGKYTGVHFQSVKLHILLIIARSKAK